MFLLFFPSILLPFCRWFSTMRIGFKQFQFGCKMRLQRLFFIFIFCSLFVQLKSKWELFRFFFTSLHVVWTKLMKWVDGSSEYHSIYCCCQWMTFLLLYIRFLQLFVADNMTMTTITNGSIRQQLNLNKYIVVCVTYIAINKKRTTNNIPKRTQKLPNILPLQQHRANI